MDKTNLPSSKCVRGRTTAPTISESGRTTDPTFRFGVVPWGVITDVRLTNTDVRVYGILALSERGGVATIGGRLLGKSACVSRRTARRSLKNLIAAGHLEVQLGHKGRGARARYRLTSPLFAAKIGSGPAESGAGQELNRGKAAVDLIRCPKCRTPCRRLLRAGWCRSCAAQLRLERSIDLKLDQRGVPRRKTFEEIAS